MIADALPMAGAAAGRRVFALIEPLPPAVHDSSMTTSLSPAAAPRSGPSPASHGAMARAPDGERFPLPTAELERMAESMLRAARAGGATAAETEVSQAVGQSVTVRNGEVETISYNRDKGIGVTVFIGQRRGTREHRRLLRRRDRCDASPRRSRSRATRPRIPRAGLADPDRLARSIPDLDLYHPWDLSVDEAIAIGREAEAAALAVDPPASRTAKASTVARGESEFVYANSNGFCGGYRSSRHHIDCSVIGDAGDGAMQRDYWYTAARAADDLDTAATVGRIAGERTARRLGARQLRTHECPVLFEAPEAADLIGFFVGAVSGGALYRKSSFLPDSLGHAGLRAPDIDSRGAASCARPRQRAVRQRRRGDRAPRCRAATACCAAISSAATRRASSGIATTGNAGGSHNLVVAHGDDDLPALLRRMGRGLLVTEQLGQGVNPVTGDFSRGAAGFWIEDGEIALSGRGDHDRRQPQDDVSRHRRRRRRRRSPRRRVTPGSILIGRMTIAGE